MVRWKATDRGFPTVPYFVSESQISKSYDVIYDIISIVLELVPTYQAHGHGRHPLAQASRSFAVSHGAFDALADLELSFLSRLLVHLSHGGIGWF